MMRFFFRDPAATTLTGTSTLAVEATHRTPEDEEGPAETAPRAVEAAEADRIARLQAFREALTRQIEEDRRRWEAEREHMEAWRAERFRLARDLEAERRLREDLLGKVELLEAEVGRLRDQPRTPSAPASTTSAPAAASEPPACPTSWRGEMTRRLGDLSARAEKQISAVKHLHDLKRLDDLERVEDLKRRQTLRRQAILQQYEYEQPHRDAV